MRINQLVEIINYERKLRGSLNSSLGSVLQQKMISNYQKKKKTKKERKKEIRRVVKLKQHVLMKRKREMHQEKGFSISIATTGPHATGRQTWFPIQI